MTLLVAFVCKSPVLDSQHASVFNAGAGMRRFNACDLLQQSYVGPQSRFVQLPWIKNARCSERRQRAETENAANLAPSCTLPARMETRLLAAVAASARSQRAWKCSCSTGIQAPGQDRLKIPQVQIAAPFSGVLCSACRGLTGRRASSWRRGGQTNAHGRRLSGLPKYYLGSQASPGPQHLVLSCTFITVTCYCIPCQSPPAWAILHAAWYTVIDGDAPSHLARGSGCAASQLGIVCESAELLTA
ncbi:hypothetical protein J3F84DRAFT_300178 [Trichoderma pleuroticola]